MEQRGVDHGSVLSPFEQITQVAQVSVAPPHAISSTVLIQHKHLAWAEPTLEANTERGKKGGRLDRSGMKTQISENLFYFIKYNRKRKTELLIVPDPPWHACINELNTHFTALFHTQLQRRVLIQSFKLHHICICVCK